MAEGFALRNALSSRWFDPALAVAFAVTATVEFLVRPELTDSLLAPGLVLVVCSTLVIRRSHPVMALAVVCAALLVAAAADFDGEFPPVTAAPVMFILSYSCGAHAPLRQGLLAVAGLIVVAQVSMGLEHFPNVEILFSTLAPWWVGWEVGRRRRLVGALEERTGELEAEEEVFVDLSVRRERARVARELHDIVAHHLAVIVVQAGAGRLAEGESRAVVSERLASIRQSGEQALVEMSRLVDIIHADSGGGDHAAGRLRALVADARAAGLSVEVSPRTGDWLLPPEVEEDALRIVQEGLTNAMKHAPGSHVLVRFTLTSDGLELEVRDGGGARPSALARTGAGLGLTGMRDRIEGMGGTLEAGPCTDGGWRLHATLPAAAGSVASAR